jgi:putative oxidoreductase
MWKPRAVTRREKTIMTKQVVDTHELITPSPAVFAATDPLALRTGDSFALVGRILLGWLFLPGGLRKLMNVDGFIAYLSSHQLPGPAFWGWLGAVVEFTVGVLLIFGVATRYGALLGLLFVIVATALAHRYWDYPVAQQMSQYNSFMKNLSIIGGLMLLYVTGAGRFSIDGWLRNRE